MIFLMPDVYSHEYQTLLLLLRDARKAAKLTQVEVAKRLGKTQGYVNKIETGERRMDVVQLRAYCIAIGADFEDFIRKYNRILNLGPNR